MTCTGTMNPLITVKAVGDEFRIVRLREMPGSRFQAAPVFHPPGQAPAATELAARAVLTGNSKPGTSPEEIAGLFVPEPRYYGKLVTSADVEKAEIMQALCALTFPRRMKK